MVGVFFKVGFVYLYKNPNRPYSDYYNSIKRIEMRIWVKLLVIKQRCRKLCIPQPRRVLNLVDHHSKRKLILFSSLVTFFTRRFLNVLTTVGSTILTTWWHQMGSLASGNISRRYLFWVCRMNLICTTSFSHGMRTQKQKDVALGTSQKKKIKNQACPDFNTLSLWPQLY